MTEDWTGKEGPPTWFIAIALPFVILGLAFMVAGGLKAIGF